MESVFQKKSKIHIRYLCRARHLRTQRARGNLGSLQHQPACINQTRLVCFRMRQSLRRAPYVMFKLRALLSSAAPSQESVKIPHVSSQTPAARIKTMMNPVAAAITTEATTIMGSTMTYARRAPKRVQRTATGSAETTTTVVVAAAKVLEADQALAVAQGVARCRACGRWVKRRRSTIGRSWTRTTTRRRSTVRCAWARPSRSPP